MRECFKIFSATLIVTALSFLTACGAEDTMQEVPTTESNQTEVIANIIYNDESTEHTDPIMERINNMSLREKVGQLYIIRPDSLDFSQSQEQIDNPDGSGVKVLSPEMAENYKKYPAGGIIMFGKNIDNPEQITEFISTLQNNSQIPLFIGTDEEGGIVSRIASKPSFGVSTFTSAYDVGINGNPEDAYAMGNTIGAYLHEYGFNMDFAPVADVNTNPNNPIIGKRSFSSDPNIAADLARSMAEALKSNDIIPVYKHFPGHGDTSEDSHSSLAVSHKTETELFECEFIPFKQAMSNDCIMIGHIALPNVVGDLTPASMSEYILQDILRDKLGFEGLIISDSLAMKAVTDAYSIDTAALTALNAGCDIVLMPHEYQTSFDSIVAAVEDGLFDENLLNEKVYKILTFKNEYGLTA